MAILKTPERETVRIFFNAPAELGARLKAIELMAAKHKIPISLNEDLSKALDKLIKSAEFQLNKF
jgi:hypothetical protein